MPSFRPMTESDIKYLPEELQKEASAKLELGIAKCEVEESSFTDPGEDYSKYWINNVCVHRQAGY